MEKMRPPFSADISMDARDINCPMSLLEIRKALKDMNDGEVLEVIGQREDLKNDLVTIFSRSKDEILLELGQDGGIFKMYIKKRRQI
jgi:tRNA 2-thiouridine synthesizing protein A